MTVRALAKPQTIALAVLAALAILILVFWIWQIKSHISRPFAYEQENQEILGADSSNLILVLQSQDTDGDGLSDYDEIYIYGTSPYLEDTDGDGISDYDEIMRGSDPNCPAGQNCGAGTIDELLSAPQIIDSSFNPYDLPVFEGGTESVIDEDTAVQVLSGEIDAATLRRLLISTGVASSEEINQISDEDLLNSYREALENQNQ